MAFEASREQEQLGLEFRKIREDRGLTLEVVARALNWDRRTLSRKESAKIQISNEDVLALCGFYKLSGPETARLSAMAVRSRTDRWWEEYKGYISDPYYRQIGLENDAVRVRAVRPSVVHGLLQTDQYMQAVYNATGVVLDPYRTKAHMRVRQLRRRRLTEPTPLRLDVVMTDSVLDKDFNRPDALYEQLVQMLELSRKPNINIQFISDEAPVIVDQSELFEFGDLGGAAVAVIEPVFGVMITDNELQVDGCRSVIEHISAAARSVEQSAELLEEKVKEHIT